MIISGSPVIGLYVPTRGKQQLAINALNSWVNLAGEPQNIQFLMGVDADDDASKKEIPGGGLKVHVFDDSVITCGGRNKTLADKMDVDIYITINDYCFAATQYWDTELRAAMTQGNEIVNLNFVPERGSFNVTACSKRWMGLANKYEPEIFPFWFSDQWRVETHCFVFGKPPVTYEGIACGGNHGRTQNLHDLDFWWGLFHALRPRRMREAYEIYKGYGLSSPTFECFLELRRDQLDLFLRVDENKRPKLIGLQNAYGELKEQGVKYKRAKAAADALIKREGLEVWQTRWPPSSMIEFVTGNGA